MLGSLFSTQNQSIIGIDIGSSTLKAVEFARTKTGYNLVGWAAEPLPASAVADGVIANVSLVSDYIQSAVLSMKTKTKAVCVALPASAIFTKKITLPYLPSSRRMEQQVLGEAALHIPFPIDEANIDYVITSTSQRRRENEVEVLLVAARLEKVDNRVLAVEGAGLKAVCVDALPYVAQRSYHLAEKQLQGRSGRVACVDIGATTTTMVILNQGQFIYSHEQALGGSQLTQDIQRRFVMNEEDAEKAKYTGNLPQEYQDEVLRPFLEFISLEIARALQAFGNSTQSGTVDAILLSGGSCVLPGLETLVAERTLAPTVTINPFLGVPRARQMDRMALRANLPSSAFFFSSGMALRNLIQ